MFGSAFDSSGAPLSPGAQSAALGWLERLDIAAAGPDTVLSGLEVVRGLTAWVAACEVRLLAAADGQPHLFDGGDDGKEYYSEEVAAVLRVEGWLARSRMAAAADLVARLPQTLERLQAGLVTPVQARLLGEAIRDLPDDAAAAIEARVLPRAADQSTAQFRRALTRAVNRVAPKVAERARAEAILGRCVRVRPAEDGMSSIWGLLPTAEAMRLDAALNHYAATVAQAERTDTAERDDATSHEGEHDACLRTVEQLRADALIAFADHYLNNPDSYHCNHRDRADESDCADSAGGAGATGRRSGPVAVRPQIQVTVALSTLLGQDDQPGELAGHGPIPASLARELAADPTSTWRRLVTDPVGRLVDYGRTVYRPPADLDHYIRAKYQTCAYPTCTRPATTSELDHVIPWSEGGRTNTNNLIPLCLRHHHLKHETTWTITHHPHTGTTHWTSPHGRTYTNTAPHLPTGDTGEAA